MPAPSYTYQWERCNAQGSGCAMIAGATAATYAVGASDVGSTIAVNVTATSAVGAAEATSSPTAVVKLPTVTPTPVVVVVSAPVASAPPAISG